MANDIILNKCETIKRCIKRINEDYNSDKKTFLTNYTRQDAVILNIERASQACMDIASHIIRINKLGVPQTSRELFVLLEKEHLISQKVSENMQKMVGFRNIAVHDYQTLNIEIIISIIEYHLTDFENYLQEILR